MWCGVALHGVGGEGIQHLPCMEWGVTVCSYTTQLLCQYTVSSQYFHNIQHCTNLLVVPLMKEVAHIHIAGIDIVTLAVLMTLQRPQHHTIVIICVGGVHLATHTTEATLLHLHTQTLTKWFFSQLSGLVAMAMDLSLPS